MKMTKIDDIRDRIIEVAQKVFGHFGFDKTTMDLIAKEARKGKSTLYYYFTSKEELYAAVIEREGNYIMNELLKIINSYDTLENTFRKYAKKRYELTKKVINYYAFVKDDYLKYYSMIQKYRHKHDEFEVLAIKQILLKGIQKDEIRLSETDVDDAAFGIAAATKGLEIPIFIESTSNTLENKINVLLDLFLYGLLKNKT